MIDLQVTRLCDLSNDANSVTSVSWSERGNQVAVGTHHGYVTVWDVAVNKQVNKANKTLLMLLRSIELRIMSLHEMMSVNNFKEIAFYVEIMTLVGVS